MLCCHEDKAEAIATGTGNVLEGESDRFSSYLIAYKDAPAATPSVGNTRTMLPTTNTTRTTAAQGISSGTTVTATLPSTGDVTTTVATTLVAAAGAGLALVGRRRHRG